MIISPPPPPLLVCIIRSGIRFRQNAPYNRGNVNTQTGNKFSFFFFRPRICTVDSEHFPDLDIMMFIEESLGLWY